MRICAGGRGLGCLRGFVPTRLGINANDEEGFVMAGNGVHMTASARLVIAAILGLGMVCPGTVQAGCEQRLTLISPTNAALIVISASPTEAAVFAAVELQDHLRKITGQTPPIVSDRIAAPGVRILVGESAATRALGVRAESFKPQEYLIRFFPNTLVLMGRDEPKPFGVQTFGQPRWVDGKYGKALAFDGTNDCLGIKAAAFPDEAGTIEAWVFFPATTNAAGGFVFRIDGAPWSYHLIERSGTQLSYTTFDGKTASSVTAPHVAPGWRHVTATRDAAGNRIELFVDGVSQGRAAYLPTHCRGQTLYLGGTMLNVPAGNGPAGAFSGIIDEVRLSTVAQAPQPNTPVVPDRHTDAVLALDEGAGQAGATVGVFTRNNLPGQWEAQATCYAVYDFLERYCGVRWYGPTEICTVYDKRDTLAVSGRDIRRAPAMPYRFILYPPYPTPDVPINMIPWGNPTAEDMRLYWHRMRNGGEHYSCNHSFDGLWDRFWKPSPTRPELFEGQHLEWFAHGYDGRPTQPCFSSTGLVGQVVQDARDCFDGKPRKVGMQASGNYFGVVPQDSGDFCKCPACLAQTDEAEQGNPHYNTGKYSDTIFGFGNRVAAELAKTHPGKYISQLAYHDYSHYPRHVRLLPNISVQMCLHVNNWWCPTMESSDMAVYRTWVKHEGGKRPLYVWLYSMFPQEVAYGQGFNCFPGFSPRLIARQMKMFARDGIRGVFLNGSAQQLGAYMYNKMADDPTQDPDAMLAEFFARYYGTAAAPMRRLWLGIEDTYCNPTNYPDKVRLSTNDWHQTEELAWKYLGTAARMAVWSNDMAEAKALAGSGVERERVALFEQGIWNHMLEGRRRYAAKEVQEAEVDELKAAPLPSVRVRRVGAATNGVAAMAWETAMPLRVFRDIKGYATTRTIDVRLLHDGEKLYMRFVEPLGGATLAYGPGIYGQDDWEVFLAGQRAKPYRQFAFNPAGQFIGVAYGEQANWDSGGAVVSDLTRDVWTAYVTLPLKTLLSSGVRISQPFYANFIRGATGGRESLAWSPHFDGGYHNPSRLGEIVLE